MGHPVSDAIGQFKNEMKTLTLVQNSGNGCIEAESNVGNVANEHKDDTNLTTEHIEHEHVVIKHDVKEFEEKGIKIMIYFLLINYIYILHCCSDSCGWWPSNKNINKIS